MSAATGSGPAPGHFDSLDDAKINRFQLKIMFVSGMGFFTDAYDLFVMGIVVSLLKTESSLSTTQYHVHLPGRAVPGRGQDHRARHFGRGRQAGRVHRRVPVPGDARLVPGHPGGQDRGGRGRGRGPAAHRGPAARTQGQEPGRTVRGRAAVGAGPGPGPLWRGHRAVQGDPTEALVAASQDADLLVLGIRGRSPFAGLLLGSVSQGAAATASCPVVLVKATDEPR